MAIGDGVSALASLGVAFGGFSPTVLDGVEASREYVERLAIADAERKEAARRKREIELARTSEPMTLTDDAGNTWIYVVIDGDSVRVIHCESKEAILTIPESIEGMPVVAIGPDALSRNEFVEEVDCPDSVKAIGSCAFRFCTNLRRVKLPAHVAEYSASWVSHCANLEELTLPGALVEISLQVFDNSGIKHLHVGPNVHEIEPGAFQKTRLESIEIDERNPFIITDGSAIYNHDGTVLLAMAKPVEVYEIQDGCLVVGKKALYGIEKLKEISIPDSVELLGEFSFSHSGLDHVEIPSTVREIGSKAFYYCKSLRDVKLNEGLRVIGNSAFEESALSALHIPASIEAIGSSITTATNIVHSGPACSIEIDEDSKSLFLDGKGGLYRREDDGMHLIQLIDDETAEYLGLAGMVEVDPYAFAYHNSIESVSLPEGVRIIGDSAFRCCANLAHIDLPDSVRAIGKEAFLDTSLEELRIPRNLEELGSNALVTKNAHHGDRRPSLTSIEVAQGNESFYMTSGILCERKGDVSRAIIYTSSQDEVVFPPEVETIADYAFNNARGIRYLEISPNLRLIGTNGLTTWCWIEHIKIHVKEPIEGHDEFDFYFPNTRKGIHGISNGIGGASWVNVPGIMAQYDNCIANAHDYNSPRNTDSIPIYDQVNRIVERLDDPIMLTAVNRSMFDRLLKSYIKEICVDIARHDDRMLVNKLVELGYINDANIESIISAVRSLQDAAMTGHLLEVRRRHFERVAFDYDL